MESSGPDSRRLCLSWRPSPCRKLGSKQHASPGKADACPALREPGPVTDPPAGARPCPRNPGKAISADGARQPRRRERPGPRPSVLPQTCSPRPCARAALSAALRVPAPGRRLSWAVTAADHLTLTRSGFVCMQTSKAKGTTFGARCWWQVGPSGRFPPEGSWQRGGRDAAGPAGAGCQR